MAIKKEIFSLLKRDAGTIYSIEDIKVMVEDFNEKNGEDALIELIRTKKVVHLIDGLFVVPAYSKKIDEYSYPSVFELVEAIEINENIVVVPTGALAENYLGLSSQVPSTYNFATNGRTRNLEYQGKKIHIEHDERIDEFKSPKINALILLGGEVKEERK